MESFGFFILLLDATLRVSVPLVLAALAGLFSERSGIVDIGLEGKMLGGAFAAAAASFVCSEQLAAAGLEGLLPAAAWVGLAAAVLWSVLLALLHGVACIRYHGNQIVSGVAINILMSGLTVLLGIAWFSQGGRTPQLPPGAASVRSCGLGPRRSPRCRCSATCTASCCPATTCWSIWRSWRCR